MKLSLELGYSHPDRLLEELSPSQLMDWEEFYNRVGFGPDRNDVLHAFTTRALSGGKLTDFMPWYEEPEIKTISEADFARDFPHLLNQMNT